jgi:hypothetical protein
MNNKELQEKYITDAIKELKLALEELNNVSDFKNAVMFVYNIKQAKKNINNLYDNIYGR